ncbi:hypothetical protein, partial [uncultured Sphingomonas sp.]|uniref:hypothetical protein n=1 Tax=uncultured Sphingomonas sp. TaxID=158754 RepID=UPI0035CB93E5
IGRQLAATMAGGLANAAARSLIDGTDFGDNVLAALPDVIGQTIGSLVADGVAGSGRKSGKMSAGEAAFLAEAETSANAVPAAEANLAYAAGAASAGAGAQGRDNGNDIVVTGTRLRDAVYRPGIDNGLFFRVQETEPNPRARMGGNGGPPLEDWRILRQLSQPLPTGPSGALFGVLDNLLDITGPAVELQSDLLDLSIRNSIGEILSIDPDHNWPDRLGASGAEGQSLRWKLANADFYRGELAATKYIVQGDVGALQNETLRVYQGFVDQRYEQALNEFKAGTLTPSPGWSPEQAIGSRMDELARRDMRAWYAQHSINPGFDINVTVNNRLATQPEGGYRIPDVRVGGVVFDASLSAKQSGAAQIRGYYSSPVVKTVIIVRPTMMTNGGAYALPRSGGR